MRPNYFTRILIVILVFIIILAAIVFLGLMLMVSYSGEPSELGPLGQVAELGGQAAKGFLDRVYELVNRGFDWFENLTLNI